MTTEFNNKDAKHDTFCYVWFKQSDKGMTCHTYHFFSFNKHLKNICYSDILNTISWHSVVI